ncbi:MAG: hypothetical protein RR626_04435, partial [Anaerovoracaceae bacterium]
MRHLYSRIIIILLLLVCSPMILVQAEDIEEVSVQWENVSTWEEMEAWLKDHKSAGGNLRLTQDIAITGDFIYSRFFSGMNEPGNVCVDTGAYQLIVEGKLHFAGGPNLTFTGDGEIFRVAKAGQLKMSAITVENRSGGCAIYQEEGGTLCVGAGTKVNGEVHYAELPVATAYPYIEIMVPKGGTLAECLPSAIYAHYNYRGQDSSSEMFVEWNPEAVESQIADRQRFRLDGRIVGGTQLIPPVAEVVFFDRDITFSETQFYEYSTETLVSLYYYCRGEITPQLYYSLDQETYTPVASHPNRIEEGKGQALIRLLKGKDPSGCGEDDILWEPGDPPISFVFGWQTEEGEQYSDVICYDGTGGVTAGKPYEGNRGGGTDLGTGIQVVQAANSGSPSESVLIPKNQAEETSTGSNQRENTSEETPDTTGLTKTAAASTGAEQGDVKSGGTRIWLTMLITGAVLLAAFGLSGVI